MSEPRAEEEKQRIRVQLMAEIARNEQDPVQCNEEAGRYNRKIFYNVRDLEQLYSITECPLTPHQVMEFKLCRSLPTKRFMRAYGHRGAKQRAKVAKIEQDLEQCNEETGWYNREFFYTLRDLQKMYTIKCPVKAELKKFGIWSSEERGKYDAEKELLIKNVRAILNKIRVISDGDTTTEKSLTKEFLDFELYQSPALKGIVSKIVDMAVKEPMLGERLAKLSQYQRIAELRTTGKTRSAFGDALLSRIDELDKGGETDENEQIDSPESLNKLGNRKFGSFMFIGHLVLSGFIHIDTFSSCVNHPFKSVVIDRYDEESTECLIHLLGMIGARLQRRLTPILQQIYDFFFYILYEFRKNMPDRSDRIGDMFAELVEQSSNGWKPSKTCNVRALLNKIRFISDGDTTTEESLTKEFLDYKVYQLPTIREIVSIIVEMAVDEPHLCEVLSKLCKSQVKDELKNTNEKRSGFRDTLYYILDKILDFEKKKESETDEKNQIDSPESLNKLRSRKFGSVNFIGHLYLHGLVLDNIFMRWLFLPFIPVTETTPVKFNEESIECMLRLQGMLGERLHEFMPAVAAIKGLSKRGELKQILTEGSEEARGLVRQCFGGPYGTAAISFASAYPFEWVFRELRRVKPFVSSRIRFMIEEVMEQRANGWKPHKRPEPRDNDSSSSEEPPRPVVRLLIPGDV